MTLLFSGDLVGGTPVSELDYAAHTIKRVIIYTVGLETAAVSLSV